MFLVREKIHALYEGGDSMKILAGIAFGITGLIFFGPGGLLLGVGLAMVLGDNK